MLVVDAKHTLLLTGNGDVVQPSDGVMGIGSGGNFAVAAARALVAHSNLSAVEIVRTSLEIAAGIDVYTNDEYRGGGDGVRDLNEQRKSPSMPECDGSSSCNDGVFCLFERHAATESFCDGPSLAT